MRGKHIFIITALLSILMLSACGQKNDSDTVATATDSTITKSDFEKQLKDRYGKDMLYEMMAQDVITKKYKVSDDDVDKELQKAKNQYGDQFKNVLKNNGLKDEADFKNQIKFKLAMNEAIKKSITEKDVKDHYKPEIKASHILVSDENEAKEIKKKLDAGASFEELAKQESQDLLSKEKGGDLGYFNSGRMAPEFETAAYKLKVGQISNPVASPNGYHIIKLTDKKALKPYDEVKDSIRKNLEEERISDPIFGKKLLQNELKKANIKINDSELKDTFTLVHEQGN
ncbi:peptidylprolyl isomerase PrsA [Bacillus paranthracis]|uniref:Foldase protein PrsA n=3 Tax=Bacillus cereus group TaxID=86661 RepID=A0A3P1BWV4_9BACI|nr:MULTISPECIES: peptidylprolyl isomerase PrsA [Bacillus]ACJ79011.1 peptidylprolyl isomerase PrsA2 [Bacillus cereus AH187]AFQ08417.1 peptidylprolyl isomerase [Bacillus cereus FRI-35]ASI76822.1 peptidylprolyl isomerase [Bacillus cereus]EEL01842.1 Foldase protein prsA 2 [Bacillus cereus BDRD-ST26]EJP95650.1 foldase prsA 2 [Bacillus cereus IS075]EJR12153.1 foldase prsA 2 [Bacillus cereus MSX-A12]EOO85738.1 foldase prsA 2 [Bacillus cereus IS845/00]EOO93718.1 foldase prsA 2 [Bacillus cereus IS19